MPLAAAAPATTLAGPRIAIESLRLFLLWLMGFAGAFVFIEPSPYEIVGVLAIFLFTLTGLTLRASLVPLALLLIFMNIGYATAVLPVSDQPSRAPATGTSAPRAVRRRLRRGRIPVADPGMTSTAPSSCHRPSSHGMPTMRSSRPSASRSDIETDSPMWSKRSDPPTMPGLRCSWGRSRR